MDVPMKLLQSYDGLLLLRSGTECERKVLHALRVTIHITMIGNCNQISSLQIANRLSVVTQFPGEARVLMLVK